SSGHQRLETPERFLGTAPNQRRCTQSRPCKRYVALLRLKNSSRSFEGDRALEFSRGKDLLCERLKTRVAVQWTQVRIHSHPIQVRLVLRVGGLEPFHRFIFLAKRQMNESK